MENIRSPAVADLFYPGDSDTLSELVSNYLNHVDSFSIPCPKAIIAPHAGYIYSGPIAASAYSVLGKNSESLRVVLLGPSHKVGFCGFAVSDADFFVTPLGKVAVDTKSIDMLKAEKLVIPLNEAHQFEHCLEVQLPFLQKIYTDFNIIPIVAGDATTQEVSHLLEVLWGGPETIIVISSDLSHYHTYDQAQRIDSKTSKAIESLDYNALGSEQACGFIPIKGLLNLAEKFNLKVTTLDCRNSGDTAGPRDQVVGYGAYAFNE